MTIYHAAVDYAHYLLKELELDSSSQNTYKRCSDLIITESPLKQVYWARNIWLKPFIFHFDTISQAVKHLRNIQRNWALYTTSCARRCALIEAGLPVISKKPKAFPFAAPDNPMGAFTLIDENTLLASAECSSPWPNGQISFIDDKLGPPSRAYKKLWEALSLLGTWPKAGERCIDAGSSPGGWTWALAQLGADITSIDRAELSNNVSKLSNVTFIKHNAFTLTPSSLGPTDWLFSDVICYPEALYKWINTWLESGLAKNIVCTIKMQGPEWDRSSVELFSKIKNSKIVHLWHNKHELTWMLKSC